MVLHCLSSKGFLGPCPVKPPGPHLLLRVTFPLEAGNGNAKVSSSQFLIFTVPTPSPTLSHDVLFQYQDFGSLSVSS